MRKTSSAKCYGERDIGSREENLETAIRCHEAALELRDIRADRAAWASTMRNLAISYHHRLSGNRAENLEIALAKFEKIREVLASELDRDQRAAPGWVATEWAATNHSLGLVYSDRVRGDQAENLERAIGYLKESLRFLNAESEPRGC
jgi:tetratricopeptide (TPR) repeat protein